METYVHKNFIISKIYIQTGHVPHNNTTKFACIFRYKPLIFVNSWFQLLYECYYFNKCPVFEAR